MLANKKRWPASSKVITTSLYSSSSTRTHTCQNTCYY